MKLVPGTYISWRTPSLADIYATCTHQYQWKSRFHAIKRTFPFFASTKSLSGWKINLLTFSKRPGKLCGRNKKSPILISMAKKGRYESLLAQQVRISTWKRRPTTNEIEIL